MFKAVDIFFQIQIRNFKGSKNNQIYFSFIFILAVEKALTYLDKDELPPHWDRDLLFGLCDSDINTDSEDNLDSDVSII